MSLFNNPTQYKHIIISGSPFLRGKSYGDQCKAKIIENIKYYKRSDVLLQWDLMKQFITNHYVKGIQKYYPSGFEEMKGIAIGADVTIEEIILLNARYDLQRWKRTIEMTKKGNASAHECTGAVCLQNATKDSSVLIGQNWDINERIVRDDMALVLEVHPDPTEHIHPFITLGEYGQMGRSGMNSNGLGIVAMALWSNEDRFDLSNNKDFVPVTLLRRMFLESPTYAIGIKRILTAPIHVSVNMIIATESGEAMNIEMTPQQNFIDYPSSDGILTHSNHFKNTSFHSKFIDGSRNGSTFYRDRRLEKNLLKQFRFIDETKMAEAFMDHFGYPESVCTHTPEEGKEWSSTIPTLCTAACVIYNLTKKIMEICKGPACNGVFVKYQIK